MILQVLGLGEDFFPKMERLHSLCFFNDSLFIAIIHRFRKKGGSPIWMVYKGKSQLEMDDNWGYPYFRKPPYIGGAILHTCRNPPLDSSSSTDASCTGVIDLGLTPKNPFDSLGSKKRRDLLFYLWGSPGARIEAIRKSPVNGYNDPKSTPPMWH